MISYNDAVYSKGWGHSWVTKDLSSNLRTWVLSIFRVQVKMQGRVASAFNHSSGDIETGEYLVPTVSQNKHSLLRLLLRTFCHSSNTSSWVYFFRTIRCLPYLYRELSWNLCTQYYLQFSSLIEKINRTFKMNLTPNCQGSNLWSETLQLVLFSVHCMPCKCGFWGCV